MAVQPVRHELVLVELRGALELAAALADLLGGLALLHRGHALPPHGGILAEAHLALVVQAVWVGLVAVELGSGLGDAALAADLGVHRGLLQPQRRLHCPFRVLVHA